MYHNAKQLQKLSIELFFNENLKNEFSANRDAVLSRFKLKRTDQKYLPEMSSSNFKVESHGRKFLISREIFLRYRVLLKEMFGNQYSNADFLKSNLFVSFLKSNYFFKTNYSLPHYAGIGKGFENCSKFFYYLSHNLKLKIKQKVELYSAIAIQIYTQANLSDLSFYRQFKEVVIFHVQNNYFAIIGNNRISITKESALKHKTILNYQLEQIINFPTLETNHE